MKQEDLMQNRFKFVLKTPGLAAYSLVSMTLGVVTLPITLPISFYAVSRFEKTVEQAEKYDMESFYIFLVIMFFGILASLPALFFLAPIERWRDALSTMADAPRPIQTEVAS